MQKIKRICLIVCLLLAFFCSVGEAFQPSKRWIWLGSNDTVGSWFDPKSVREVRMPGDYRVFMWVLFYQNSPSESVTKVLFNVDLKARTLGITDSISFDMEGNSLGSAHYPTSMRRMTISPESRGETLYMIAKVYHAKRAARRSIPERV